MRTRKPVIRWTILFGLVFVVSSLGGVATRADPGGLYIRLVRTIETSQIGLLHPAGLAYSPGAGEFIALQDSPPSPADLIVMTPFEDLVTSLPVNVNMNKATSMAFDAHFGRLLLLEPGRNRLTAVNADATGRLDPSPQAIARFGIQEYGLVDPQGIAVDPETGQLCIADPAAQQIVCVQPDGEGDLDGKKARDEERIGQVSLPAEIVDPTGLALSPSNGHFYLVSAAEQRAYQLTRAGQMVAFFDLSPFGLADPQGLVFAPSADSTDPPSTVHLYLADTGLAQASAQVAESAAAAQQAPGRVLELSLDPTVPPLAAPIDEATLERTTDTSLFVPPSPDPSGLAYLPGTDTLLISDGEVDEMSQYFTGDNLFETTLSGSLMETYTTISYSYEPTGVA